MKEIQYRKLTSKINRYYLNIHVERSKTYNAFIIQLKINKIEFNKFLHERRVVMNFIQRSLVHNYFI